MSIIAMIEAEIAKAEGELKAEWNALRNHALDQKLAAEAALEAEIAKGSAELQSAWARVKAYL